MRCPADCAVFFVMATYGEGEPTDNAVTLLANLREDDFSFSNGAHELPGLKYVVFGLGNRTYEHYNVVGRQVDEALAKAGGVRIGERGEGDDDKSMEEDYLAWKDGMWDEFSRVMAVEEGAGADTADFVVHELNAVEQNKVYLGSLRFPFSSKASYPNVDYVLQVNSQPVRSTRPKGSTIKRTRTPRPSLKSANSSNPHTTGTAYTSSSISKVPVSLTSTGTTSESGHRTPMSKLTDFSLPLASTRRKTPSSLSRVWIRHWRKSLSPYPPLTGRF